MILLENADCISDFCCTRTWGATHITIHALSGEGRFQSSDKTVAGQADALRAAIGADRAAEKPYPLDD